MQQRPLIWVLKGLRAGDTAQAMALALQLGGRVESKQLAFNRGHWIPNWLAGARNFHLTPEAKSLLRPPWPDLVVGTGRRTAAAALWIKRQSGNQTKIVQIGRPRMNLAAFDLVVTTPQYGLPLRPNVIEIPVPFVPETTVSYDEVKKFELLWRNLPRPWIVAVIGGAKFPMHLRHGELVMLGQSLQMFATSIQGSVIVVDSPRSPVDAVRTVVSSLDVPHWGYERGKGDNPYRAALTLADQLVVTSDSVSMITDMLNCKKPTSVFMLPVSRLVPRWSAARGLGGFLAAKGMLHPPRDVQQFVKTLIEDGLLGRLPETTSTAKRFSAREDQKAIIDRIKVLLTA